MVFKRLGLCYAGTVHQGHFKVKQYTHLHNLIIFPHFVLFFWHSSEVLHVGH